MSPMGIPTSAIKGEDDEATYYKHITTALDHKPQLTVDDGADLVTTLHTKRSANCSPVHHGRHRGNHHGSDTAPQHGKSRQAAVPHHRRE